MNRINDEGLSKRLGEEVRILISEGRVVKGITGELSHNGAGFDVNGDCLKRGSTKVEIGIKPRNKRPYTRIYFYL